jgi:plasmid stabilization system protein ParE
MDGRRGVAQRVARRRQANPRIAIVRPFLIVYDHEADTESVTVLRVVHGGQRITEALLCR